MHMPGNKSLAKRLTETTLTFREDFHKHVAKRHEIKCMMAWQLARKAEHRNAKISARLWGSEDRDQQLRS